MILCFYCGVDSKPLILFYALIVGSGVLSLLCFVAWALINGHLRAEGPLSRAPLEAERKENET
jgi:hypothetical protein